MKTITLAEPWTYRTPLVTVDYGAGEHLVTAEVAKAAEAEGVLAEQQRAEEPTEEKADDDGVAAPRAPRRARTTQG